MKFVPYTTMAERYDITVKEVIDNARRGRLQRKRTFGEMGVDALGFQRRMKAIGQSLAPSFHPYPETEDETEAEGVA